MISSSRYKRFLFTVLLLCGASVTLLAQSESNYLKEKMQLNGYVKYLATVAVPPSRADTLNYLTDNLIHNRLNYYWYISPSLTLQAGMRNRLFYGEITKQTPGFEDQVGNDDGFFDLTFVWTSDSSMALTTVFDRLNLNYQKGNFEMIVGRQRINWGIGLVWNPNDVFNAFSFFDFDYEERPGTDAVLLRYYTGASDQAEVVYELGNTIEESSFAGYYKTTKNNYDLQFFGAYKKEVYIGGLGWSGDIKTAGFRGEVSYFNYGQIKNSFTDQQLVGMLELDYTFKKGLYLHGAYLYNSAGINTATGDYQGFFLNQDITAASLSPTRHSIFGELSKDLSPIVRGTLFSIVNPSDQSWFFGPLITWSVANDFEFMANAQIFIGDENTAYGDYGQAYYLRFKYSF